MHKNYRKTLCKHTNFQKIKKNKNRHNAQKRYSKKSFFVQNVQTFQKITKNFKKAIAFFLIIGYNSIIRYRERKLLKTRKG